MDKLHHRRKTFRELSSHSLHLLSSQDQGRVEVPQLPHWAVQGSLNPWSYLTSQSSGPLAPIRSPRAITRRVRSSAGARTDAVILGENTVFIAERRRIADLAVMHRLPMMFAAKEYAEAGELISYGTDYPDLFRRAAMYIDKILRGAKPADLPIEQPTKFELVINLKTAKALGLTIPPSLLLRADQVIE